MTTSQPTVKRSTSVRQASHAACVSAVTTREAATAADGGKALAACQLVEAVQAQAAGQPAAHAGQAAGAVHVDHACRNV